MQRWKKYGEGAPAFPHTSTRIIFFQLQQKRVLMDFSSRVHILIKKVDSCVAHLFIFLVVSSTDQKLKKTQENCKYDDKMKNYIEQGPFSKVLAIFIQLEKAILKIYGLLILDLRPHTCNANNAQIDLLCCPE